MPAIKKQKVTLLSGLKSLEKVRCQLELIGQTAKSGQTKGSRPTTFRGLTNKLPQFCPARDL